MGNEMLKKYVYTLICAQGMNGLKKNPQWLFFNFCLHINHMLKDV